jgi:hypothetical protein
MMNELVKKWFPAVQSKDLPWSYEGVAEVFTMTSVEVVEVGEGTVRVGGRYQVIGDGDFGPEVISEDEMQFDLPFRPGDLEDPDFWAEGIEQEVRREHPGRGPLPIEACL